MNYLAVIVFVSIVGLSMVGLFGIIDDGQELSEINSKVQQKNIEIAVESLSIKGDRTDGTLKLSNYSNEEIRIIQIRVYDELGNYVKSFDIDEIIQGNTEITIEDLPISLQEMLVQWKLLR